MTISELIGNSNPGHPGLIGLVRMSRMLNIDLTCRVESDSENEWL